MTAVTLKLQDDVVAGIDAEAKRSHRNRSDVMRELMRRALNEKPRPSLLELAGDDVGRYGSGINDLATNPAHLEGLGLQ